MNISAPAPSIALPALGSPERMVPRRLLSDQRLGELAGAGDERSFSELYERHFEGLYRYALSMLGSEADASDAVQTAMMNALLALPAKKKDTPLAPWLYRITHNEAVSLCRRRRGHEDIADHPEANGAASTHDDVALREDLRQLVADMLELPERQRAALIMRELNGLDYGDIGTAFSVSEGAARQAVYEGRVALHEREQGRQLACQSVQRSLSSGDRRVLRGRRLRAHLRGCGECRDFDAIIRKRRDGLEALAPAFGAGSILGVLKGIFGGSAGSGGAAAGGAAAGGTIAVPMAVKTTLVAVALVSGAVPATKLAVQAVDDPARPASQATSAAARVLAAPAPPLLARETLDELVQKRAVELRSPRSPAKAAAPANAPRREVAPPPPADSAPQHTAGAHPEASPQDESQREENGAAPELKAPKPKKQPAPPQDVVPAPEPAPVTAPAPVLQAPGSGRTPPGHAGDPRPGKKPHPHGGPPGLMKSE